MALETENSELIYSNARTKLSQPEVGKTVGAHFVHHVMLPPPRLHIPPKPPQIVPSTCDQVLKYARPWEGAFLIQTTTLQRGKRIFQ